MFRRCSEDAREGPLRGGPGSPPTLRTVTSPATPGHVGGVVPPVRFRPLSHHSVAAMLVRQPQRLPQLPDGDLVEVELVGTAFLQRRDPQNTAGDRREFGIRLDLELTPLQSLAATGHLVLPGKSQPPDAKALRLAAMRWPVLPIQPRP
ncbi:MAG UNVERIFIED_CONTAM: hypothetical protein LVR18_19890 [Planctomycetaceae bacterium]